MNFLLVYATMIVMMVLVGLMVSKSVVVDVVEIQMVMKVVVEVRVKSLVERRGNQILHRLEMDHQWIGNESFFRFVFLVKMMRVSGCGREEDDRSS